MFHSLAIDKTGAVWAWGRNNSGQLGNNTDARSNIPVHVTDGTKNLTATAIAAGASHSLAIDKTDNTVQAWGYNYSGQLGNHSRDDSTVPVHVTDGTTHLTATAIAAGDYHSLAIDKTDNTVQAWGNNSGGQLGKNTYNGSNIPVPTTITNRAACPTGSGPTPGTGTCSLAANTTYTYRVTTHIGRWTTTSESTPVTTKPSP